MIKRNLHLFFNLNLDKIMELKAESYSELQFKTKQIVKKNFKSKNYKAD